MEAADGRQCTVDGGGPVHVQEAAVAPAFLAARQLVRLVPMEREQANERALC